MTMRSLLPSAGLAALLAGCSGGGGDPSAVQGTSGDLVVLRTEPANNGRLFLNESIRIDFSNQVDLATADLNTVAFQVFDLNGLALSEQPQGTFALESSPGDETPGRRLVFAPRFPTNDTFDNGGFKPGRRYVVQLVGGDARNGTVLRDRRGRGLAQAISFEFQTADGTTPAQLFRDTRPGGPRKANFTVTPNDATGVSVNQLGLSSVEVVLEFDQPLNPNSMNVPVNVRANPLQRSLAQRGRIFLEYDDGNTRGIWIPATVDLESNSLDGSTVVLRPIGVLPNNAVVRVIVENTVEDMSGESNVSDAAYNRVFESFRTRTQFDPIHDAIVENFDSNVNQVDDEAAFLEPRAVVQDGRLVATFAFEGSDSRLVYQPSAREVILNTDFTQIVPLGSPPINVAGGVFNFREVTIPEGVLVRGEGTQPMVWLVNGDFTVNGTLTVDGGLGGRVDTLNSANFATPGGTGNCGGGAGGAGSPNGSDRSLTGQAGFGPGQRPAGGGGPGQLSCTATCNRGSAGGGGSFVTQGDPYYPPNVAPSMRWPQTTGTGGKGCTSTAQNLPGGEAGRRPFVDSRSDNDFWGSGVNVFRRVRISGELLAPVGGQGGGGGGDRSSRCNTGDPGFINDNKGGGGGGGAGVLIIQALGKVRIGRDGHIAATGGDGGGGEQAGSNNQGGGGGGGSGGMVVIMAGGGIDIHVHGRNANSQATYGNGENDFDFPIAADGGVSRQGRFGGLEINGKYANGRLGTTAWGNTPTGGFGGLGLVQLLVPPGSDADMTGNALDDNVTFFFIDNSGARVDVTGTRKRELIAWRGWPDETGQLVDDDGNPTNIGDNEGEIRPSPIMLPAPFGPFSRARSEWVDLGSAARRLEQSAPGPNTPGVVVSTTGQRPNPDYGVFDPQDPAKSGFPGTASSGDFVGYANFTATSQVVFPEILPGDVTLDESIPDADLDGQPAYLLRAPAGSFGTVDNRYAHYRAQLRDQTGTAISEFRILSHTDRVMFLAPEGRALPTDANRVQILAKFFEVATDGQVGLGPTRSVTFGQPPMTVTAPEANVRIGFAFHTDPADPMGSRFPADPTEYVYDLQDPMLLQFLENERPTFAQWDVLFNKRFDPSTGNNLSGEQLNATLPEQVMNFLVIPVLW